MKHQIFTVGHSNHTFDKFVEILKPAQINAIVDCRSVPYSKFAPQFNKENIGSKLNNLGIKYIPMSYEFGARREENEVFTTTETETYVDFSKCWGQPFFKQGVERLQKGCAHGFRVALLCSEADPIKCHRTWMVGHYLWENNLFDVLHLLKDSSLMAHDILLSEKINKTKTIHFYSKSCAYKK